MKPDETAELSALHYRERRAAEAAEKLVARYRKKGRKTDYMNARRQLGIWNAAKVMQAEICGTSWNLPSENESKLILALLETERGAIAEEQS